MILSNNPEVTIEEYGDQSYVYPQNAACVGKDPYSMTIPDGDNYDNYCQNQIPKFESVVKGKGYYCKLNKDEQGGDVSTSGEYYCKSIKEVIDSVTVSNKIKSLKEKNNAFAVYGGRGDTNKKQLTKDLCDYYSLSCKS